MDEELEHYRLLAYMQRIQRFYQEHKLYPHLDELRTRRRQLEELRERKRSLVAAIPQDLLGVDLRRGQVVRSRFVEDPLMRALDEMIEKALTGIQDVEQSGSQLRNDLTGRLVVEPIGVQPLSAQEGYLLIRQGNHTRAYTYSFSVPARYIGDAAHLDIRSRFIADFTMGYVLTFERIKSELVRRFTAMPNPAVFAVTSSIPLPAIETHVPLAKQLVYELVTTGKR